MSVTNIEKFAVVKAAISFMDDMDNNIEPSGVPNDRQIDKNLNSPRFQMNGYGVPNNRQLKAIDKSLLSAAHTMADTRTFLAQSKRQMQNNIANSSMFKRPMKHLGKYGLLATLAGAATGIMKDQLNK